MGHRQSQMPIANFWIPIARCHIQRGTKNVMTNHLTSISFKKSPKYKSYFSNFSLRVYLAILMKSGTALKTALMLRDYQSSCQFMEISQLCFGIINLIYSLPYSCFPILVEFFALLYSQSLVSAWLISIHKEGLQGLSSTVIMAVLSTYNTNTFKQYNRILITYILTSVHANTFRRHNWVREVSN